MKAFKKGLAAIVTSLLLACGHGNSQVHYSRGYDGDDLFGIKVQNTDGRHAIGLNAHYGRRDGNFYRNDLPIPLIGDVPVYGDDEIHRIILSPYVDRELYRWQPCDYFSSSISLGVGYRLELNITSTDYKITVGGESADLDNVPSSVKFPGHFLARVKPELRLWQVPLHYTFTLDDNLDFAHFFSVGYEF